MVQWQSVHVAKFFSFLRCGLGHLWPPPGYASDSEDGIVINLKGTVTTEEESTPICLQLRGYFARLLASKKRAMLNLLTSKK